MKKKQRPRKKVKVLLINPPITKGAGDSPADIFFPLGLSYLAAVLEKENFTEVSIIDALALGPKIVRKDYSRTGLSLSEIVKKVKEIHPDIVGISTMFSAYAKDAHQVAEVIKKVNPKTFVVFGGTHASCNYDLVLKDKNVDLVVKGEGEITFLEIVKYFYNGKNPEELPGTIVRKKRSLLIGPSRALIKDLDSIPPPARHFFLMDTYLKLESPYCMRKPIAGVITSRGCPGHCVYCSIHAVWGSSWRGRGIRNVVDEIEKLVKKYGVKEISFFDDSASIDKKRWEGICDEIIRRKLNLRWTTPNGIAHWTLDKPLLAKMKKAGCYRITFGIESGNLETRKYIGKPYSLDQAKELIKHANRIGMWTICTNIIGFPNETGEQIKDTINYAVSSETDFALFYPLTPFRGTPVYDLFKKYGLISKEAEKTGELFVTEGCRKTNNFTKEEISDIVSSAYRQFMKARLFDYLLHPYKLLWKIHSIEDLLYLFRLFKQYLILNSGIQQSGRVGAKAFYRREDNVVPL